MGRAVGNGVVGRAVGRAVGSAVGKDVGTLVGKAVGRGEGPWVKQSLASSWREAFPDVVPQGQVVQLSPDPRRSSV